MRSRSIIGSPSTQDLENVAQDSDPVWTHPQDRNPVPRYFFPQLRSTRMRQIAASNALAVHNWISFDTRLGKCGTGLRSCVDPSTGSESCATLLLPPTPIDANEADCGVECARGP